MCIKTLLDDILRQMLESYHSVYGNSIVAVYMLGSYAREDFDDESDIDIAAIVKGERLELQGKLKILWDKSADIGLKHDIVISPTVIPFAEYEAYKEMLPYYRNIWKEGKKIG